MSKTETSLSEQKLYQDKKSGTTTFKCPNCGGEAKFSPKKQKMVCNYCGCAFEVKLDDKIAENKLDDLLKKAVVWKDVEVYQCESCGAKEIISKQDVAMKCPFCGTSNIIKSDELAGLKPQGVVPFKLEKAEVSTIAKKWVKKKWLAPNKFRNSAEAENIKGVYSPVFTFDSDTKSSYEGQLGKNYTTTTYINGKPTTTVHTRYFHVSGNHDDKFDDLLIPASSRISTQDLAKIEPFETNDATAYKTELLRGYTATTYSKDGETCWTECQQEMNRIIEINILKNYDYDVKSYLNITTDYLNSTYKFVLLPIYVGAHTYNKKVYNFYVNGVTGKITGKAPYSGVKITFLVLGILLVLGAIIWLAIKGGALE